jgi:hypothetical protein
MTDDAVLAALADARRRKDQADRDIRLLLAYAREIAAPRPYRLADLAQATGVSISGIRVAYAESDIQEAIQLLTGNPGSGYRRHITAAVTTLLTLQAPHLPAPATQVS